jgi:hypothetical protein
MESSTQSSSTEARASQRPHASSGSASSGVTSGRSNGVRSNGRGRELKKTIYPPVVGRALRMSAEVRVALWDRALRRVRETQEATLLSFVRAAEGTEYGRRYGFSTIRRYEDYAARVPVGDYDSFSPYIERMRGGEANLLVPETIRYFGNSSGSSNKGKSKFLPIGERQIKYQRGSACTTGRTTSPAATRSASSRRPP